MRLAEVKTKVVVRSRRWLYGEVRPNGHCRFVNFGHLPPLVFSAEYRKFMDVDKNRMAQFLPLGLQIPEDHPDRTQYFRCNSDNGQAPLMSPRLH